MRWVVFLILFLVLLTSCVTIIQEAPQPAVEREEETVEEIPEEKETVEEITEEEETVEGEVLPKNQYRLRVGDSVTIAGEKIEVADIMYEAGYFTVNDETIKVSLSHYPELVGPFKVTILSFDFAQEKLEGEDSILVEIMPFTLTDNQYLLFKGDIALFVNNNKVQLDDIKRTWNTEYVYVSIIGTNIQEHRIPLGKKEMFDKLNFTGTGKDILTIEPIFAASKKRNYAILEIFLNPVEDGS